jgi:ferrochelatase
MSNVAVVLFQLGGPDSIAAVEPFLYNLFRDPDIFDFPGAFLGRKLIARRISSRRAKPVAAHYQEIGGKSPINELTESQARELERSLRNDGVNASVHIAMRYWRPLTEETIQRIKNGSFDKIVLLPLYPHFSRATTYSSMNEWNRKIAEAKLQGIPTAFVCCYPSHPLYIEALVENINLTLARFDPVDPADVDLVFSAHGVPVDFVERGDPYQMHIEKTVRATMERGGWRSPHALCYQSKVGSSRWLEPSLHATISALARNNRRHLLVVPVAFVTDHIETLHEINIEAREEAIRLGIRQFEMMPALNSHPKFIQCLAELVKGRISSGSMAFATCDLLRAGSSRTRASLCPWHVDNRPVESMAEKSAAAS